MRLVWICVQTKDTCYRCSLFPRCDYALMIPLSFGKAQGAIYSISAPWIAANVTSNWPKEAFSYADQMLTLS